MNLEQADLNILMFIWLQSLKDLMEIMKDKDSLLKIRNKNHNLILEQVDSIIVSSHSVYFISSDIVITIPVDSLCNGRSTRKDDSNTKTSVLSQTSLDLEPSQQKALMDGNLSTTAGIEQCIQAAEALQKCMSAEIHPCECHAWSRNVYKLWICTQPF